MSGRIWPGALCEIVRSYCGNEGRRVVAEEPGDLDPEEGPTWVCLPLQPLHGELMVLSVKGWRVVGAVPPDMERSEIPASFLRPITPPPGSESTEDRAPVRVGA